MRSYQDLIELIPDEISYPNLEENDLEK